jgi:hypothetical protein
MALSSVQGMTCRRTEFRHANRLTVGLITFAGLIACGGFEAHGQEASLAGILSHCDCAAELRESPSAPPRQLTQQDTDLPLSVGEQLHCKGPGHLTMKLFEPSSATPVELPITAITITQGDKWFTVRQGLSGQEMEGESDSPMVRGWPPDESSLIIFSPPQDGVVSPTALVVRWNPVAGMGRVSFFVSPQDTGRKLCCKGEYAGSAGSWTSKELREALAAYDPQTEGERLDLEILDSKHRIYQVSFSVLGPQGRKQLARDLSRWARKDKDTIARLLGRGFVFAQFQLYTESANQYEAALQQAPANPLLRQLAIAAERRTGNLKKLKSLEGAPPH